MNHRLLIPLLALAIAVAGLAQAREAALPLGLHWCQSIGEVLAKMPNAREMNDDVLDSTVTVWGVEGFLSAIMDEDKLVGMRFRAFELPSDLKKVQAGLRRGYGEGGTRGTSTSWAPGGGVSLVLKLQSEQIFVAWETAPGHCGGAVERTGLSDQEKADAEALKDKKAVDWDPYADDVDKNAVKKKVDAKKKEEEKEEEKKDEPTIKDDEVDW
jgi:hypothetical protein